MTASKTAENVIWAALAIVGVLWAVKNQDKLKMYFDNFVNAAQMQLGSNVMYMPPAAPATPPSATDTSATPFVNPGTNITGFPNTPPATTSAPPDNTAGTTNSNTVPSPVISTPSPPPPSPVSPPTPTRGGISSTTGIPPSIAGTILPPSNQAIQQTQMDMMMQNMLGQQTLDTPSTTGAPVPAPGSKTTTGMPIKAKMPRMSNKQMAKPVAVMPKNTCKMGLAKNSMCIQNGKMVRVCDILTTKGTVVKRTVPANMACPQQNISAKVTFK